MEFVAVDFETDDSGRPWQLGAARFDGDPAAECELRDWRFENGDIMPLWEEISGFLVGRRLVAHNLACERTILTRLAPLTRWGPWSDTLKIARKRYPGLPGYDLGTLCGIFGCVPDMEGRTWHDGLFDAVACGKLYGKIA